MPYIEFTPDGLGVKRNRVRSQQSGGTQPTTHTTHTTPTMKLPFERTACFALGVMLTVAATAPAKAQTPIHFASGSDTGAWAGYVNTTKDFTLGMGKGQRLWVQSDDIYTCKVVAPSGRTNDCLAEQGVVLSESGAYKVKTTYRMDGGSSRYVSIQFTVR